MDPRSSQVVEETLHHRGTILVRRLSLAPGEATRWHRDPFHRITVVFQGAALAIEFRDGRPYKHVKVKPRQVDWDEPGDRHYFARKAILLNSACASRGRNA